MEYLGNAFIIPWLVIKSMSSLEKSANNDWSVTILCNLIKIARNSACRIAFGDAPSEHPTNNQLQNSVNRIHPTVSCTDRIAVNRRLRIRSWFGIEYGPDSPFYFQEFRIRCFTGAIATDLAPLNKHHACAIDKTLNATRKRNKQKRWRINKIMLNTLK